MNAKRILIVLGVAWLLATGLLLVPAAPVAKAENTSGPANVGVGIYLISFGNYDANKGTYVMDFYIWFRYNVSNAPPGFAIDKFEFMNGRAAAKDKISDDYKNDTGNREVWYRVQANLYSDPQFKQYPFDKQTLTIMMEDANYSMARLVYAPLKEESGLDPALKVAGWRIDSSLFTATAKEYKFGETYSRLVFQLDISREPTSTGIKTLLPPIVFCAVSALSFFFPSAKMAQRITLGTSMLISAVMFHISQTASLPPLGSLILIDKIMISSYTCLASSLVCTALVSIDDDYWKDRDYTKYTNKFGGLISVILPFITFTALSGL